MISQDLKLSERIEIIAIQSDKTSDRIHELSVQSDKTAIMHELAVQSDKFVIQMHKLSVQVNELSNKTDKLKVHNLRLQPHCVTTHFFFPLIITDVSTTPCYHSWGLPAVRSCSVLPPSIHHAHHLFPLAASICTVACHHFFFLLAVSIRSVWAVTTQEKVRELAAFVIFFWIISMFL